MSHPYQARPSTAYPNDIPLKQVASPIQQLSGPCCKEVDLSPIEHVVQEIDSNLSNLDNAIARFERKVESVITPPNPEKDTGCDKQISPVQSVLLQKLIEISKHIACQTRVLSDVSERIQL